MDNNEQAKKPDPKNYPPVSPHDLEWGGVNQKYFTDLANWEAEQGRKPKKILFGAKDFNQLGIGTKLPENFGRTDIDYENAATEAMKKLKSDNPEDFKRTDIGDNTEENPTGQVEVFGIKFIEDKSGVVGEDDFEN